MTANTQLWIIPYLIVFSTSIVLVASNIFMPSLPKMVIYFKSTNEALLATVSIFYYSITAAGLAYGFAADFIGRRFTMLFGCATFFIGGLVCLIATHLWLFIFGIALQGM